MAIPYGGVAAAGGLVSLLFGAGTLGWQVAAAGAAVLLAAVLSLKAWKAGGSSLPFTVVSGGEEQPRTSVAHAVCLRLWGSERPVHLPKQVAGPLLVAHLAACCAGPVPNPCACALSPTLLNPCTPLNLSHSRVWLGGPRHVAARGCGAVSSAKRYHAGPQRRPHSILPLQPGCWWQPAASKAGGPLSRRCGLGLGLGLDCTLSWLCLADACWHDPCVIWAITRRLARHHLYEFVIVW
jgi:hypothetical protein